MVAVVVPTGLVFKSTLIGFSTSSSFVFFDFFEEVFLDGMSSEVCFCFFSFFFFSGVDETSFVFLGMRINTGSTVLSLSRFEEETSSLVGFSVW